MTFDEDEYPEITDDDNDTLEALEALEQEKPELDPIEVITSEDREDTVEEKPLLRLEVFLKVAGSKWDQLAGFKYYARQMNFGPATVLEWQERLRAFHNKPVRG